jgi:release factor H-coupled RctB family protein
VSSGEEYRGPPARPKPAAVRLIGDNSECDKEALDELKSVAKLSGVVRVWGMPDLHSGPTGCVIGTVGCVYPRLVGGDAGCGMAVFDAGKVTGFDAFRFKKYLPGIGSLSEDDVHDLLTASQLPTTSFDKSLGTIGGSNHFAEFQAVDIMMDSELFDSLGIKKDSLILTVHSGSRGYGKAIFEEYGNTCIDDPAKIEEYMTKHDSALRWGVTNRRAIGCRLLSDSSVEPLFDICHNQIVQRSEMYLHRKGAAPADQGFVIIPGSRGSHSYIVKPKEGIDLMRIGSSLAHGAGRRLSRKTARAKAIKKCGGYLETLLTTALDSLVSCTDKQVLCEEIPEAYKDIEKVIADLQQYVHVVVKLRPILTIKDF